MTSHELANKLLALPDKPVSFHEEGKHITTTVVGIEPIYFAAKLLIPQKKGETGRGNGEMILHSIHLVADHEKERLNKITKKK